jgi:glycerate 2-kinase
LAGTVMLGEKLNDGLLIAKHLDDSNSDIPAGIRLLRGGHPVPTDESADSTAALAGFLNDSREDDLVFCLVSGGGSALMTLPVEGVSLEDLQALTSLLLASGADITEMNTLRKHLDQIKGGGLARMVSPARLVTLILSDVIGSPARCNCIRLNGGRFINL